MRTDGTGTVPLAAEPARAFDARASAPATARRATTASRARTAPGAAREIGGGQRPAPPRRARSTRPCTSASWRAPRQLHDRVHRGAGTENRNHNIRARVRLVERLGGEANDTWSFNGTSGECNDERGFQGAGAIIDGEYDDAVGGGICQVATTMFNAVYEPGFPVPTRYNHSLYIGSYPHGTRRRGQLARARPRVENDSATDVLVRTRLAPTRP